MLEIHQLGRTLPRDERFRLRDQVERSSSSVPDNIAEGYAAYYYDEKIKHMLIARREASETQNHLKSMEGKRYITVEKANDFIKRYERVIAGINSFINFVREKRDRDGRKGRGKSRITYEKG